MLANYIKPLDPRHDPAQALAWFDALDPFIRAHRLRTRIMGTEILVQALVGCGIQATTVTRCFAKQTCNPLTLHQVTRSDSFVHLPCVQGHLFSFDGFQGNRAWEIALSNRHVDHTASVLNKNRHRPTRGMELRTHTRYLVNGEEAYTLSQLSPQNLDYSGNHKLKPDDAAVASDLMRDLHDLKPPAPLPANDYRLATEVNSPLPFHPGLTAIEQALEEVWGRLRSKPPCAPGEMTPPVLQSVLQFFREAGIEAQPKHRIINYRGAMEVFDIHRIGVELIVPGQSPRLLCISAPGGWEGLTPTEMQKIQARPDDRWHAGPVEVTDEIECAPLEPIEHEIMAGALSSCLMGLSVPAPAQPDKPTRLRRM